MSKISSSYSARLSPFFTILQDAGIPLESWLEKANLPMALLERADVQFSARTVYRFLNNCELKEGIEDLAYLGSREENFSTIERKIKRKLVSKGTLNNCLNRYGLLLRLYNGRELVKSTDGLMTRVALGDGASFDSHPMHRFSDWSNIMVLIGVFRHVLGPSWFPSEIGLRTLVSVSAKTRQDFPNVKIRTCQPSPYLTVETKLLAQPIPAFEPTDQSIDPEQCGLHPISDFPTVLGGILRPYIAEGKHSIFVAAEACGLSARTLQRRLKSFGLTYSGLVEQERISLAREMLANPEIRITDVAYELGYQHPTHFARAFRRMTSLSPTDYRASWREMVGLT